jgi:hypothetical protein
MQQVFDVVLWLVWPSLFPEYVTLVSAPCAFAAVVSAMRSCGAYSVAHAAASMCNGLMVYRAFQVRLREQRERVEASDTGVNHPF